MNFLLNIFFWIFLIIPVSMVAGGSYFALVSENIFLKIIGFFGIFISNSLLFTYSGPNIKKSDNIFFHKLVHYSLSLGMYSMVGVFITIEIFLIFAVPFSTIPALESEFFIIKPILTKIISVFFGLYFFKKFYSSVISKNS